jgi:hypothetical protein
LLHHLPALVLRRPTGSAGPAHKWAGARGSRMRDRGPPAYPGSCGTRTRSFLSGRSLWCSTPPFFPLNQLLVLRTAVLLVLRPAGGLKMPLRPAAGPVARPASAPASEPHCRTSQHARLQPGAFTEYHCVPTAYCTYCGTARYCSWQPLSGHPVRPSAPSPSCEQPRLRNSTAAPHHELTTTARQFISGRALRP